MNPFRGWRLSKPLQSATLPTLLVFIQLTTVLGHFKVPGDVAHVLSYSGRSLPASSVSPDYKLEQVFDPE